jgi:hypothetical protein
MFCARFHHALVFIRAATVGFSHSGAGFHFNLSSWIAEHEDLLLTLEILWSSVPILANNILFF